MKKKKKVDYFGLFKIVDDATAIQRRELLAREYESEGFAILFRGMTNEEIKAEIKRISNTWYLWASRYTGDVVEDFKTLVDICKDEKNSIGFFCAVFEDDLECFDSFRKKYGIEPSYSIGKGDYHYDDEKDDDWSNLCYEFDTAVRPVLCLMWKYYNIVNKYR